MHFLGCQLKCLCIIFLVCEPIHFFIEYVGAPQIGSHLYILVSDFCMAFVQEVSTPVFREQILLFQRYLRTGVLFLLEKDSIQAKRYSYDPNVRHIEMVFD